LSFINYVISQGLKLNLNAKLFIQPIYFPVLGFIAVSLSSWNFIFQKILEMKSSSKKVLIKSLKLIILLFVAAATSLYLPYILTSNWFASILTDLAIKAPQWISSIEKLSFALTSFWSLNELEKYVFSQFLGASTITLASLIEGFLLIRETKKRVKKKA
jgi:hypothetical protein